MSLAVPLRTLAPGADASSADCPSEPDEDADFERTIGKALEKQDAENRMRASINGADLLLKLGMLCGDPGISPEVSEMMNGLLCRVASAATGYSADEDDAIYLQNMFAEATVLLERALSADFPQVQLNITRMGMLRTAHQCLCAPQSPVTREYSRAVRESAEGLLADMLRSGSVLPAQREQYATGEAQAEQFELAVEAMRRFALRSDAQVVEYIQAASEHLVHFLNSLVVPCLNDGQRMGTANCIAARYFGREEHCAHRQQGAMLMLNADQSNTSLARVIRSCGLIVTLACYNINRKRRELGCRITQLKSEGGRDADVQRAAQEHRALSGRFDKAVALMHKMRDDLNRKAATGRGGKPDTPGGIMLTTDIVARWFETSMFEDIGLLLDAVTAPALVLAPRERVSSPTRRAWKAHAAKYGMRCVCIWGAVDFLSLARLEVHKTSMPVTTGLLVVLSGIVGSLLATELAGPFVLCKDAEAMYFHLFNCRDAHLPQCEIAPLAAVRAAAAHDQARNGTKRNRDGSPCHKTKIISELVLSGQVRKQNEKGQLVESRLAASLFVLAIKEALMRDAPAVCATAPGERNKNLRRMYIVALQALPSEKHACSWRADNSSYLVEWKCGRSRTAAAQSAQAPKEKCDKPWRDINGGVLFGTLYYPLAGEALLATVETIDWDDPAPQEPLTTDRCVAVFLQRFEAMSALWFDSDRTIPPPQSGVEGSDRARAIFAQQRDIVRAICRCLLHSGGLWEYLQNTFSMHPGGGGGLRGPPPASMRAAAQQEQQQEQEQQQTRVGGTEEEGGLVYVYAGAPASPSLGF